MTSRSFLTARSLIVAILSLILATGVVAAARPDGDGGSGRDRTSETPGDPHQLKDADATDDDELVDENVDEAADPDADAGAAVATDAATTEHPENHGKYVSEAAHATTPEDCANHGAYVRLVAKSDLGKKGAEPGELPTSCVEAAPADPTAADATGKVKAKHARPANAKGHGKGLNR